MGWQTVTRWLSLLGGRFILHAHIAALPSCCLPKHAYHFIPRNFIISINIHPRRVQINGRPNDWCVRSAHSQLSAYQLHTNIMKMAKNPIESCSKWAIMPNENISVTAIASHTIKSLLTRLLFASAYCTLGRRVAIVDEHFVMFHLRGNFIIPFSVTEKKKQIVRACVLSSSREVRVVCKRVHKFKRRLYASRHTHQSAEPVYRVIPHRQKFTSNQVKITFRLLNRKQINWFVNLNMFISKSNYMHEKVQT